MTSRTAESGHFWSRRVVVYSLLALIVLLGGVLRYTGINWDDFSASHPDERFLTQNLLPLLGSGLEFTDDQTNFPTQSLISSVLQPKIQADILTDPDAVVAVVAETKSRPLAEVLTSPERVREYADPDSAIRDVMAGRVSALLIDASLPILAPEFTSRSVNVTDSIGSERYQQSMCLQRFPQTGGVGGYFDARCSNLNPNNSGAGFYAYGTLPLFIAYTGLQVQNELIRLAPTFFTWQGTPIVWRFLSAFFDVGSILLVFFIGARLHNRWTGLLAALIYATAPLAIEKSHFGTVNAISAFFVTLGLWAAVGVQDRGRLFYYAAFGAAFGCAMAGRINLLPLIGVLGLAMIVHTLPAMDGRLSVAERNRLIRQAIFGLLLTGGVTVLVFRLTNPYAFTGPGFFGMSPNSRFLADIASAQFGVSGNADSPPNYQWVGRMDYVYPLKDIVLWGLGLAPALLAVFGWLWSGWQLIARRLGSTRNLFLFAWVLVYFGFMGRQWVMTMRYFLPIYSALALLAAWAVVELIRQSRLRPMPITRLLLAVPGVTLLLIPAYYLINQLALTTTATVAGGVGLVLMTVAVVVDSPRRAYVLAGFVGGFAVLWGLMYTNIYRQQLTRVQASRWVSENIPGDFAMQVEGAPDGTPLINIALRNNGGNSATDAISLVSYATHLFAGQAQLAEFVAPADGVIQQVIAPHIGNVDETGGDRSLYISLAQADSRGDLQLLAEQTLTSDFSRSRQTLGDAYTITFPQPVPVRAGESYTFKVELLEGTLVTGNVVVTEGDWDDRITTIGVCHLPDGLSLKDNLPPGYVGFNECNLRSATYDQVNSFDTAMSLGIDNEQKLESIRSGLHNGDYFVSTSNRFYDSEARNDLRFPMTNRFYRALFAGQLGYEVIQVFSRNYAFAGLEVADQWLPTNSSPAWFNEFEPDEAFHVYDHPVVYILKKRADYDPAAVDAFLDSLPLNQSVVASPDTDSGSQLLGVTYWDSLTMDGAPNGLMQAPDQYALNQAGGTWSQRFDRDSLLNTNQLIGAGVWWLVIALYGMLAFPVMFVIFPRMTDRGYGVSRLVGLFLVAWVTWFFAGLKVPLWSQAGVVLGLVVLAAFSTRVVWRRRTEFAAWLRAHGRLVMGLEALALVLFLVMIGLRLSNPDLWHYGKGGEKPMDFAMMNAVLRATTFPAQDVWYAGGNLNYYYWGYVLFGSPVLLLKMVPSFAYNLIIPTVFMVTGLGVFSAAFNITAHWRGEQGGSRELIVRPVVAGIAALLLCIVLGNLDTIRVIGNGVAILGGYQQPQGLSDWLLRQNNNPDDLNEQQRLMERAQKNLLADRIAYEVSNSLALVSSLSRGVGSVVQGVPLPIGTDRWYWGPSRVLAETPGVEGGAITEMPAFTFIYGDLHAHMMNFPVLLFVILFLFSELAQARNDQRTFAELVLSVLIGGAVVGMIQAINTWDWPAYLLFGVIALGYAWWLRFESFTRQSLTFMTVFVGGFILAGLAASLPYRTWYAGTYGSVAPWTGGRTPLWAYVDLWGLFLFLVVSLLVWETARWLRAVKVRQLRGRSTLLLMGLLAVIFVMLLGLALSLMSYQVALLVLPLVIWIAILFFRPRQSLAMQFVLVCTGLALLMTLGVEVIVMGGDSARQNTVFKFYLQAWILLSVAGGCAFAWLMAGTERWRFSLTTSWFTPLVILIFIAALFPVLGTRGRSYDRMDPSLPPTLNGADYMASSTVSLNYVVGQVDMRQDAEMIRWLQDHVQGTPIIMEGREPASEYTWTGRIGINTGLPMVLGWRFHQTQQRTFPQQTTLINQREANVNYFYRTDDIAGAFDILQYYDVSYVVVGQLEKAVIEAAHYADLDLQVSSGTLTAAQRDLAENLIPDGIIKFDRMVAEGMLTVAFAVDDSIIYAVNRDRFIVTGAP